MGSNGFGAKRRVAAVGGIVAVVLAGASFAYACTSGNEQAKVFPTSGTAGQPVVVTGSDWLEGEIKVYLASTELPPAFAPIYLGKRVDAGDRGFVIQVTIPEGLQSGTYSFQITRWDATRNEEVLSRVAAPLFTVRNAPVTPAVSTGTADPVATPGPGTAVSSSPVQTLTPAPAAAPVPAIVAATQPEPQAATTPVAEVVEAPAPTAQADTQVPAVPVAEGTWEANPGNRSADNTGLLDDSRAEDSNRGMLVGAGLLAMGSVALFAGFTVAVARRRRAHATASF